MSTTSWSQERIQVAYGTETRYLANASDPGLGESWVARSYDDSAWSVGQFGLGYQNGIGAEKLLATSVPSGTMSVYARSLFEINSVANIDNMFVGADYDDGVVMWLNGVEIYRSPEMPTEGLNWNTAPLPHESSNGLFPNYGDLVDVSDAIQYLTPGLNVLAVGVWNDVPGSSDLVVVPQLITNLATKLTRRPYVQMVSPTEATLCWRTDVPRTAIIYYGVDSSNIQQKADSNPSLDHCLSLSGLQPDTEYFYALGDFNDLFVGGTFDYSFKTAPLPGVAKPTRIWITGDGGTGNIRAKRVRDQYYYASLEKKTDLWLMLGDNAYPDGTDEEYQTKFFDLFSEILKTVPVYPTFGNHDGHSADSDTQTGPYYDIFQLPTQGELGGLASGTEAYYSFDYGNIHFVVLDSYDSNRGVGQPMLTWLEQDLAATTQDWIIAYWHHPIYSKGSHDSDQENPLIQMRTNALPILEDYGVDLTFQGHSHDYERSYLIDSHYGLSGTLDPATMIFDAGDGRIDGDGAYNKPSQGLAPHEGAIHTVAGSAGQVTGGTLDHPANLVSLNEHGSVILEIDGRVLNAQFLDEYGDVRDSYRIVKGDVPPPPVADFAANPVVGAAPLTVDFVDLSQNSPNRWQWDFEADGTIDASTQNPQHVYDTPGLYSVSLDIENLVSIDDTSKSSIICVTGDTPGLVPTFSHGPSFFGWFWNAAPGPNGYDLIRGDLQSLRDFAGDFTQASLECIADGYQDLSLVDPVDPPLQTGYFYLIRAQDCGGTFGSFESGGSAQLGLRDPGVNAAVGDCSCACDSNGDGLCEPAGACAPE